MLDARNKALPPNRSRKASPPGDPVRVRLRGQVLAAHSKLGKYVADDLQCRRHVVGLGDGLELDERLPVELRELHDGREEMAVAFGELVVLAVLLERDRLDEAHRDCEKA
jgi:hypothetical protein